MISVAFAPDGKTLASMTSSAGQGRINLWEVGSWNVRELYVGPSFGWRLAFAPDGKTIAAAYSKRDVVLVDGTSGVLKQSIPCPANPSEVAFSPDRRLLAISQVSGDIRLWDLALNRERTLLRGHVQQVGDVNFSPDGRSLASSGKDGTVRVWDVPIPPPGPMPTPGRR